MSLGVTTNLFGGSFNLGGQLERSATAEGQRPSPTHGQLEDLGGEVELRST